MHIAYCSRLSVGVCGLGSGVGQLQSDIHSLCSVVASVNHLEEVTVIPREEKNALLECLVGFGGLDEPGPRFA